MSQMPLYLLGRKVACSVCAITHGDASAPVLAYLVAAPEPDRRGNPVSLLWPAARITVTDEGKTHRVWEPDASKAPLADRADTGVILRCPRCGQKTGPITARKVMEINRRRAPAPIYLPEPGRRPSTG